LQSRVGVLADRLHCSRSTLYKLAPSKEELFVLIVDRYADAAVHEAMREAEAQCSPIEKVAVLLETVANWQRMGSAAFWTDAMEFEGTAARFSEKRAWGIGVLRGYLDEGVSNGAFRPANTAFIAHLVWMGMLATRDSSVLDRVGLDTQGAVREIGHLILSGMSYPQPMDADTAIPMKARRDCA